MVVAVPAQAAKPPASPKCRKNRPYDEKEKDCCGELASWAKKQKIAELAEELLEDSGPDVKLLHRQSVEDGCVDCTTIDCGRREKVVAWLITHFASVALKGDQNKPVDHPLRDEWLFAAISLLDRLAKAGGIFAASSRPSETRVKTEALAAVLVALKMSQAETECDHGIRGILFAIVRKTPDGVNQREFWDAIVSTEMKACRALQFKIAVPTALDLASCLAPRIAAKALQSGATAATWGGLAKGTLPAPKEEHERSETRFALLAFYLIELAMVHAPSEVYQGPPCCLTFAALELAFSAFGVCLPPSALAFLESSKADILFQGSVLAATAGDCVPVLKSKLWELWASPPAASEVAKKWHRREVSGKLGGAFPKPASASSLLASELAAPQEMDIGTPQKQIRRSFSEVATPQPVSLRGGYLSRPLLPIRSEETYSTAEEAEKAMANFGGEEEEEEVFSKKVAAQKETYSIAEATEKTMASLGGEEEEVFPKRVAAQKETYSIAEETEKAIASLGGEEEEEEVFPKKVAAQKETYSIAEETEKAMANLGGEEEEASPKKAAAEKAAGTVDAVSPVLVLEATALEEPESMEATAAEPEPLLPAAALSRTPSAEAIASSLPTPPASPKDSVAASVSSSDSPVFVSAAPQRPATQPLLRIKQNLCPVSFKPASSLAPAAQEPQAALPGNRKSSPRRVADSSPQEERAKEAEAAAAAAAEEAEDDAASSKHPCYPASKATSSSSSCAPHYVPVPQRETVARPPVEAVTASSSSSLTRTKEVSEFQFWDTDNDKVALKRESHCINLYINDELSSRDIRFFLIDRTKLKWAGAIESGDFKPSENLVELVLQRNKLFPPPEAVHTVQGTLLPHPEVAEVSKFDYYFQGSCWESTTFLTFSIRGGATRSKVKGKGFNSYGPFSLSGSVQGEACKFVFVNKINRYPVTFQWRDGILSGKDATFGLEAVLRQVDAADYASAVDHYTSNAPQSPEVTPAARPLESVCRSPGNVVLVQAVVAAPTHAASLTPSSRPSEIDVVFFDEPVISPAVQCKPSKRDLMLVQEPETDPALQCRKLEDEICFMEDDNDVTGVEAQVTLQREISDQAPCLYSGMRVRLVPGSRYAAQNAGCATLTNDIHSGEGAYVEVTFDDGFENSYQFEDLEACPDPVAPEIASEMFRFVEDEEEGNEDEDGEDEEYVDPMLANALSRNARAAQLKQETDRTEMAEAFAAAFSLERRELTKRWVA